MMADGYNWLFANEDEDNSGDEEEDLEEIQSILYAALHYEQVDDDQLPATEVTTSEVAYNLDLQEEVLSVQGHDGAPSTSTPTQVRTKESFLKLDQNDPVPSTSESASKTSTPISAPSKVSKSSAKKRKGDIDVIDLVSESDTSAASGEIEQFIVIDSISDESVTEITPPVEKRRKTKATEESRKRRSKKVIATESRESSDSSQSSEESDFERTSSPEDLKINVHLAGRQIVLNCDDLDKSDIQLETTLEDVHASLGECDWSLTDNSPKNVSKTKRSRTMSRYYTPFDVKCYNCEQVGHLSKLCPKPKKKLCCLCGESGHLFMKCPDRLCHNCGKPGHELFRCPNPKRSRFFICQRCGMAGHKAIECSELWRQYHLTTAPGKLVKGSGKEGTRVYCYNCGEKGHWGYECEEERMSKFVLVSCPLMTYYDRCRNSTPRETRNEEDKSKEKPSSAAKNLKEKLKSYVAKARKATKKTSSKVSHVANDENANKMEYKFAEDFPRGDENSSRGHSSRHHNKMPSSANLSSRVQLTCNEESSEKGRKPRYSEKDLDTSDIDFRPMPKGYTRKAFRKLLLEDAIGVTSNKRRKKIISFSKYAKEQGIYEQVTKSVAMSLSSKKHKGQQATQQAENSFTEAEESSVLHSPASTETTPKKKLGKWAKKKLQRRAAEGRYEAMTDIPSETLECMDKKLFKNLKRTIENDLQERLPRDDTRPISNNKSYFNKRSPSSSQKKKKRSNFRFDTVNNESKHWRRNPNGFRFGWRSKESS